MKTSKQLFHALILSIVFLAAHIMILKAGFTGRSALWMIIGVMICIQMIAYGLLRRNSAVKPGFTNIFKFLGIVQTLSIFALTFFTAARSTEAFHVTIGDLLASLFFFALLLPLVMSTVLWLLSDRFK